MSSGCQSLRLYDTYNLRVTGALQLRAVSQSPQNQRVYICNGSRLGVLHLPINICTSCGPASFKKVDLVWAAHALASRVLPVPGGPYNSTPLGG